MVKFEFQTKTAGAQFEKYKLRNNQRAKVKVSRKIFLLQYYTPGV
jgi:hypothetical protein